MEETELGITTLFNCEHSANKEFLITVIVFGSVTLSSEEDAWQPLSPMLVTLSGMVMLGSAEQPRKASLPMVVRAVPSGKITLVIAEQRRKASSLMLVTETGMLMLSKARHS